MLAIVLIPSAALLIIGVGGASYLVHEGYTAEDWATTTAKSSNVDLAIQFTVQVGAERRLSLQRLGGDQSVTEELAKQRDVVNGALTNLRALGKQLVEENPEALKQADEVLVPMLGQVPKVRQGIDAGQMSVQDAYKFYSQLIQIMSLSQSGLAKSAPDPVTAVEASSATSLFNVAEAMGRSNALAVSRVANGQLSNENYQEFSRQVGFYHGELESMLPTLPKSTQARYAQLAQSEDWKRVLTMESALLLAGPSAQAAPPQGGEGSQEDGEEQPAPPPLPVGTEEWQAAAGRVSDTLLDLYSEQHRYAAGFAAGTGEDTFRNSLLGGAGILLITIIAAFVAARLSTRLVTRMKRLRAETLELADTRLPRIVQRLRAGEQININREVPPLDYGGDELGAVAEAFNKSQRTAVAAAAHEAEIQNGFRTVFLNIAHRSQVVVRRQLEVLDKAEREQEDPEQLEALFQLDHLATRARRNAENLLILGGERPGRRWRNPVPLVEIVRSAIGETEHYKRVNTGRLPDLLMLGSVVADLIHLLAELVDNATAFSPPDSRVEVHGNRVGNGVVVEVEDQGVGIPPDEREAINSFLQNPPDFGVMSLTEEARLGLFVVSQLSARHGISITLVDSAYGGIRAIVLIRSALIASGPSDIVQPAESGQVDLPRPRRQDLFQTAAPEQAPEPAAEPVPALIRTRPEFPDDLSWPEDPAEQTIRWPTRNLAGNSEATPPPQPANGNGRARHRSPGASAGGAVSRRDGRPPLPRRRRQANLAPQLTGEAEETQAESSGFEHADPEAAAEQARDRLSAFQRGTREGRAVQ